MFGITMPEAFEERIKDASHEGGMYLRSGFYHGYGHAMDRIAQLETELADARKDQARYKFVRDMTPEEFENTSTIHEDFDCQIDAAIKEQQ